MKAKANGSDQTEVSRCFYVSRDLVEKQIFNTDAALEEVVV